ncbi:hypothetical protein K8I85_08200, partial [bacterium]|nr:hypothetical protein [bacterium]
MASLRDAVAAAANGDTILLGPGTFTGLENRNVIVQGKDLAFESMSGAGATRIDCELAGRALLVNVCNVVMTGITVTRGRSDDPGGAISAVNAGLTVQDCWFQLNSGGGDAFSGGGGGAVFVTGGRLAVSGCRFEQNHASAEHGVGGGIAAVARADVTIANSLFEGNTTGPGQYSGGAGLYTWDTVSLIVEQSTFQDNSTWEGAA